MTYEQNSKRGPESSSGRTSEGLGATADQVRQQAQQKLNDGREQAASGIDSLVSAASAAAEDLREHNQEGLSRYVSEIADSVSSVASSLRNKSVDELIHEVEAVARRNPTLFLAGSLAIGLGIGRFARASSKTRSDGKDYGAEDFKRGNENYPRNVSGDADPERAGSYGSGQVTEEDYLADDFARAGGGDDGLESSNFSNSGRVGGGDPLTGKRHTSAGRIESNGEIPTKPASRQRTPGSGNQPIGGDFYE